MKTSPITSFHTHLLEPVGPSGGEVISGPISLSPTKSNGVAFRCTGAFCTACWKFSKGNFGCIQSLHQWSPAQKNKQTKSKQVKEEGPVTLRPGSGSVQTVCVCARMWVRTCVRMYVCARMCVYTAGLGWAEQAGRAERKAGCVLCCPKS